jgi:hypothetical protein
MNAMTQPIRVILNTREPGFRAKTYLAYVALFTLLAGDAVRYSVGWWGWGAVLVTPTSRSGQFADEGEAVCALHSSLFRKSVSFVVCEHRSRYN